MSNGQKFFVKLPVVNLEAGVRAMLIYARLDPNKPGEVQAIFHRVDGRQQGVTMALARAMQLQKQGPFVLLAEVEGDASQIAPGRILGPNGQPL